MWIRRPRLFQAEVLGYKETQSSLVVHSNLAHKAVTANLKAVTKINLRFQITRVNIIVLGRPTVEK